MKRDNVWRRAKGLGLRAVCAVALSLALSPQPSALAALAQGQPSKPIIVRIPQDPPKSELSGLADVLLGSLGLTGVIAVAAVLLGAVMAGVMFWVRSRESR
jgi:ABC-type phosphate transport system permease subunit